MKNVTTQRIDFKTTIIPHLELLLQYSLWLTKNGLDATRLMREALLEATQLFHESPRESDWDMRVQEILTRRFLNGHKKHSDPITQIPPQSTDEDNVERNEPFQVPSDIDPQQAWLTAGFGANEDYLSAMVDLPGVCRSAMILSYNEGLSTAEIAALSGDPPEAIEDLLGRGRGFIREQLFQHLIGDIPSEHTEGRGSESA